MSVLSPIHVEQVEDKNIYYQHWKLREAIIFLSLDYTLSFYSYLFIPTLPNKQLQKVMRSIAISFHQYQGFEHSKDAFLLTEFKKVAYQELEENVYHHLQWWMENIFLSNVGDSRECDPWYSLLLITRRDEDKWHSLGLPNDLSDKILKELYRMFDTKFLADLDEDVFQKELSVWDTEMFSRYDLYRDGGNYMYEDMRSIYRQIQYRLFMNRLVKTLDHKQLQHFFEAASARAKLHKHIQILPEIATQLLPSINNPKEMYEVDIIK